MSTKATPVADDPQVQSWERFFKTYYREQINEAVLGWPSKRSLVIDYFGIENHDGNLAQFLLDHPYEALAHAAEALKSVDVPGADLVPNIPQGRARLQVRVRNLPADARLGVADLRMEHAGRLVEVAGLLQAVAPVTAKLLDGVFICSRCGNLVRVPQDEHMVLVEPTECYQDQGGCGREAKFKLVHGTHRGQGSVFIDLQVATHQETPEGIAGARPPVSIPVFLEGDLCGSILPSQRVRLVGVVRVSERRIGNKKTPLFDYFLEVIHVEHEAEDYEEIDPTPEEIAEFRELAESRDLVDKLVGSLAPTIYGRRQAKLGILMQLFGGVTKDINGRHIRGDIHVLIVGDPGIAKSVLGKSGVALSPRGQYVNALTASVAGMVGGVDKVEKSLTGEGYMYRAGVVSMAHRGFVHLDEADKPRDEALLPALLEPLEQQTASINKHGARGILVKCEFALLATANPKTGRFDPSSDLLTQFDFPRPFLDRMDLVFAIPDSYDDVIDTRTVDTMLRTHEAGVRLRRGETVSLDAPKPIIEPDFLRRYIAWAKRTIHPIAPPEVQARIRAKYLERRRKRSGAADGPVGASPRMVDTLTRLAEAAARMRLSETISDEDLSFAMDVYTHGWEKLATNERGELDVDRLGTAPSYDQRQSALLFKHIIWDMQGEDGVRGDEAVAAAIRNHITTDMASSLFARWKKDGTFTESTRANGRYKLTSKPAPLPGATPPKPAPTEAPAADDDRRVRWM